jgi:hypothetical protein
MTRDDHLIEHLRSSMHAASADMFPPPGLLDGVSPKRPHLRAPSLGSVVVVGASALTLVLTLLAIAVLSHGRGLPSATVSPATQPGSRATTLAALRSELAVLRRPQQRADRLPAWGITAEQRQMCSNCLNVAKLVRHETRLLATIHLSRSAHADGRRERVYLVVGTVPQRWQNTIFSGWRQRGAAGHGLHLSLVGLTTSRSREAQPQDELLNYAELPMPAQALTPHDVLITTYATIGVVPDGVTRVKWRLANPGQRHPATVYPRVHGNLATAPWTPAPRSTRLVNEQLLVGATWYGADGRVIASFADNLEQINKAYGG